MGHDFPGSIGRQLFGMGTFFAIPILVNDTTIGTICGASLREVAVEPSTIDMMHLVADSVGLPLQMEIERRAYDGRRSFAKDDAGRTRAKIAALTKRTQALQQLALRDPLTGIANRRAFTARWEEELARSSRHDEPVALLLIDIDAFKDVNDTFGHAAGDAVLCALAEAMRAVVRSEDMAARTGGDEFALLLPHSGTDAASTVAARLRGAFADRTHALHIPCTLSIGVSASTRTARRDLMTAADLALYRSKNNGRDRVTVWTEDLVCNRIGETPEHLALS